MKNKYRKFDNHEASYVHFNNDTSRQLQRYTLALYINILTTDKMYN